MLPEDPVFLYDDMSDQGGPSIAGTIAAILFGASLCAVVCAPLLLLLGG